MTVEILIYTILILTLLMTLLCLITPQAAWLVKKKTRLKGFFSWLGLFFAICVIVELSYFIKASMDRAEAKSQEQNKETLMFPMLCSYDKVILKNETARLEGPPGNRVLVFDDDNGGYRVELSPVQGGMMRGVLMQAEHLARITKKQNHPAGKIAILENSGKFACAMPYLYEEIFIITGETVEKENYFMLTGGMPDTNYVGTFKIRKDNPIISGQNKTPYHLEGKVFGVYYTRDGEILKLSEKKIPGGEKRFSQFLEKFNKRKTLHYLPKPYSHLPYMPINWSEDEKRIIAKLAERLISSRTFFVPRMDLSEEERILMVTLAVRDQNDELDHFFDSVNLEINQIFMIEQETKELARQKELKTKRLLSLLTFLCFYFFLGSAFYYDSNRRYKNKPNPNELLRKPKVLAYLLVWPIIVTNNALVAINDNKDAIKHHFPLLWKNALVILLLLVAMAADPDYGFYTLLRIVVFLLALGGAWAWFNRQNTVKDKFLSQAAQIWPWLLVGVAIVYNPLVKVSFDRDTWQGINFFTVCLFAVEAWHKMLYFKVMARELTKESDLK